MDKKRFWELIETTNQSSKGNPEKQVELLTAELAKLSESEIFEYQSIYDDLEDEAYIAELWDIAGIMAGGWGCSDDGFMDFRAWLIAQGKDVFEKALVDPESLVDIVEVGQETQIEDLLYVATYAYELKTGQVMPIRLREKPSPELKGDFTKDEDLTFARFPTATAKYWNWWIKKYG